MNIPKIAGRKGLKFSFFSDSTCFLKIDMQSTNKLESNKCPGASFEPGDRLNDILVFHDGSSLTSGVSIYLAVENKGKKRIAIAKEG